MLAQDRAIERKPVTPEVHMITSLLNLRNTLKKNYEEKEIMQKILNFDFIEGLMREHLKMMDSGQVQDSSSKYLPRDPRHFAQFSEKM